MAIVENKGVVLRSRRYRETSRIVSLLTPAGRLDVLAKAARGLKSPFGAALEPFGLVFFGYYERRQGTLHLLRHAWLEEAWLEIVRDPVAFHVAQAALETVLRLLAPGDASPRAFDLLVRFLRACEKHVGSRWAFGEALLAFRLRLAAILGYEPRLDRCASCGGPLESHPLFDPASGGLLCSRCAAGARGAVALPVGSLVWLKRLSSTYRSTSNGGSQRGRPGRRLAEVVETYFQFHIPGYTRLRSVSALDDWLRLRSAVKQQ